MAVVYDGFDAFEHGFLARVAEAEQEFLDSLKVAAEQTWQSTAKERLQATAGYYADKLRVRKNQSNVTVTVPAGIPSAVDIGTNEFGLADGFFNPRTRTKLLERAPGNIRWKTIRGSDGKTRRIPLDGGWPEKTGGSWIHPGIKERNITKDSVDKIDQDTLPTLMESFVSRVTA